MKYKSVWGATVAMAVVCGAVTGCASGVADPQAIGRPAVVTSSARSVGDTDQTIPYSGNATPVIITAPAGATALQVEAVGGSGGTDGSGDHVGGFGAVVDGTIPVSSAAQQFAVTVGGQGGSGPNSGGWGAGAETGGSGSGTGTSASGGGGGATMIQMWDATTQSGQGLIIAAGGGGAGSNGAGTGGNGGAAGQAPGSGTTGGGSQPGAGGLAGTPVGLPMGQDGNQAQNAVAFGGGGGAGFGGGGGGTSSRYGGGGGGGAGMSNTDPSVSGVTVQTADESGNGQVIVQWVTG